jgi:hypothetical protein
MVERNDWDLHKECAKNTSVEDSQDDNYVKKDSTTDPDSR